MLDIFCNSGDIKKSVYWCLYFLIAVIPLKKLKTPYFEILSIFNKKEQINI